MRNGHTLNRVFSAGGKENKHRTCRKVRNTDLANGEDGGAGRGYRARRLWKGARGAEGSLGRKKLRVGEGSLVTTGLGAPPVQLLLQLRATAAAGEARALQDVAVVISPMEWHWHWQWHCLQLGNETTARARWPNYLRLALPRLASSVCDADMSPVSQSA